jgi:hypothetical protein
MKKDILSQEDFKLALRGSFGPVSTHTPAEYRLIKCYAAALDRIAEIEKEVFNLARKSADLETELLERDERIAELESRLAEYEDETETGDTPIDAQSKARAKVDEFISKGYDFEFYQKNTKKKYIVAEKLLPPDGGSPEYFEFPYSEPREPQIGDLMIVDDDSPEPVAPIIVYGVDSDFIYDQSGNSLCKSECKPTGYRVNENGDIVKIKRSDR